MSHIKEATGRKWVEPSYQWDIPPAGTFCKIIKGAIRSKPLILEQIIIKQTPVKIEFPI